MSQVIIAVIVTGVIVAPITWFISGKVIQKANDAKIGNANERAREIIDEALKTAETKKREALLEAKEESLKTKNELEKETKERRAELQRYERRVLSKEENLDKKAEAMEKREAGMNVKEEALKRKTAEAEALYEKGMLELEKISGLTSEQAKEYLLRSVEEDVKHDTAKLIKDLEAKAKEEAEKKANKRFFASAEDVPKQAYTMGIKTIMQAKKILIVASGEDKAEIVQKAFFGPITPQVPASVLQLHNDVTLVADEAALSKLSE